MTHAYQESRQAVELAREALRRGDRKTALKWGQEAARLAPDTEDPWLILAAVASPQASVNYIKRALQANPDSARAKRGMQWAMQRLQSETPPAPAPAPAPARRAAPPASSRAKRLILPGLLLALGCLVVFAAAAALFGRPALTALRRLAASAPQTAPAPTQPFSAVAELPKPTYTPVVPPTRTPANTSTPRPTSTPAPATSTPEALSTAAPEEAASPTNTPEAEPTATPGGPTSTPGLLEAVIVEDTPTSEFAPTSQPPLSISAAVYGERWIDVDLSRQLVSAYEGDTLMNSFIVSTGTWQTPTVTGTYKIWIKLRSTTMTGPGYYLPNVPYTMYFYKGYGLHGTYWHNNFGTPMSHGCVNLSIGDAEWLYNFSVVGTTVNVHY